MSLPAETLAKDAPRTAVQDANDKEVFAAERDGLTREKNEAQERLADPAQTHAREIAFSAQERDGGGKQLDRLKADLELEKQARAELVAALRKEIDGLTQERDALAKGLEAERAELSKKVSALSGERDELAGSIEAINQELARAHDAHAREMAAATHGREDLIQVKDSLVQQLAQAREHHRQETEAAHAALAELTAERDAVAAEAAGLRESHGREVETLAAARGEHRRELEAYTAERGHFLAESEMRGQQRDTAVAERDRAVAQFADLREATQQTIASLTHLRDETAHARDELGRQLAEAREAHLHEVKAHITRNERLSAEVAELTTVLAQTRARSSTNAEALGAERDAATRARDEVTGQLADVRAAHASLTAQRDDLARERDRSAAEAANIRATHDGQIEALTTECRAATAARDELRAHLDALEGANRVSLETAHREHRAVISECDEARALLERDRQSWSKQIELFTEERETLMRERESALEELTHERQNLGQQLALRAHECDGLARQRTEALAQIQELREAQKRQGDLFGEERKVLLKDAEETNAKLDLALKSLGLDRVTLLQQRIDALGQLDAAIAAHRQEMAAREQERDQAVAERDAMQAALTPFQEALRREQVALGTLAVGKYAVGSTVHEDGGSVVCAAKDVILGREVEVKVIRTAASSPEETRGLLDEARRLARLQHPNIPPIYEVGINAEGQVFYTTKIVRGMPMRDMLDQLEHAKTGAMLHFTLKRLLAIFHKVCDALAYAHAQGITHGAVRPECIVLGDFGEVFVTHWRLPRDGREADPHEDIAALGRLLHEITTLERFDETESFDSGGTRTKARRKRAHPSTHWAGDESVQTLLAVARRALDRRAADKFHSVHEFQTLVDAFKDSFHEPTHLSLSWLLAEWVRRHKVAVIFVIVLLLALGGLVATGTIQKMFEPSPRTEIQAPTNPAHSEPSQP